MAGLPPKFHHFLSRALVLYVPSYIGQKNRIGRRVREAGRLGPSSCHGVWAFPGLGVSPLSWRDPSPLPPVPRACPRVGGAENEPGSRGGSTPSVCLRGCLPPGAVVLQPAGSVNGELHCSRRSRNRRPLQGLPPLPLLCRAGLRSPSVVPEVFWPPSDTDRGSDMDEVLPGDQQTQTRHFSQN